MSSSVQVRKPSLNLDARGVGERRPVGLHELLAAGQSGKRDRLQAGLAEIVPRLAVPIYESMHIFELKFHFNASSHSSSGAVSSTLLLANTRMVPSGLTSTPPISNPSSLALRTLRMAFTTSACRNRLRPRTRVLEGAI